MSTRSASSDSTSPIDVAQRLDQRRACRVARPPAALGGEAGLEQRDQPGDDVGVGGQRLLDVALAERQPGLAQPLHVGAHDGDLPPVQPGQHDQRAEAVVLGLAAPDRAPTASVNRSGSERSSGSSTCGTATPKS